MNKQPPEETWEKEFDNRFTMELNGITTFVADDSLLPKLKQFIQSEIRKVEKRVAEDIKTICYEWGDCGACLLQEKIEKYLRQKYNL